MFPALTVALLVGRHPCPLRVDLSDKPRPLCAHQVGAPFPRREGGWGVRPGRSIPRTCVRPDGLSARRTRARTSGCVAEAKAREGFGG